MRKCGILPLDGIRNGELLLQKAREFLSNPNMAKVISHIKINDGAHMEDMPGPIIVQKLRELFVELGLEDVGVMLDLKLGDTEGTLANYGIHYSGQNILTASAISTGEGFLALRKAFPGTKIALVSALTDMKSEVCRKRYGHFPDTKILNDIRNIEEEYAGCRGENNPIIPFDLIVCSPHELEFLGHTLQRGYGFVVPGIRDKWMTAGQQKRFTGVREALELGATYVVMGAQMTKGNPKANPPVSVENSQLMTIMEIEKAEAVNIVSSPMQTLFNCGGYYKGKKLVAYAGKYDAGEGEEKNYVGYVYANFAQIDQHPAACDFVAMQLANRIKGMLGYKPDVIVPAPIGGLWLAADVARHLYCRRAMVEKKILALEDRSKGQREESTFVLKRHEIRQGDKVVIVEDTCNNFSSTDKLINLIQGQGGEVVAIACFLKRSMTVQGNWYGFPVIALEEKPIPQYRQDDLEIAADIAAYGISFNPKGEWDELMKIMGK